MKFKDFCYCLTLILVAAKLTHFIDWSWLLVLLPLLLTLWWWLMMLAGIALAGVTWVLLVILSPVLERVAERRRRRLYKQIAEDAEKRHRDR